MGWEEPCAGCEGESPGEGVCLAQPARPAWLPGRCATNVVDAGSLEAQNRCLCLIGTFSDFRQTEADKLSNLERGANSLAPCYRAQSQRKVKSKVYAQTRSTPTGMVRRGERSLDQAGTGTSPKDGPQQRSQSGQHLGNGLPGPRHLFHLGITQLWCCCHPRGQVSPSRERLPWVATSK